VPSATLVPQLPALVDPVSTEIATLPLQAVEEADYPLSARTGEPQRPGVIFGAIVAGWVSVATTVGAFAYWWWQAASVTGFHGSARLLGWFGPDPVSWAAVALVVVVAALGVLMVAAAGMVAYNAWAGNGWIRLGSLVGLAVTGVSFLLSWFFSAAMVPLAVAALLVWLPSAGRFFAAMKDLHTPRPRVVPTTGIRYGRQPLIGRTDVG
jgi:hypothetical protein